MAVVANRWRERDADVSALQDRGHVVVFQPGAAEVHREAAGWFRDRTIYRFVESHLHLITRPSLRLYLNAAELRRARLDWRANVLSRLLTGTALKVARLKADPAYRSEEERVRAFVDAGDGCRATYFNHASALASGARKPRIRLAGPQATEGGGQRRPAPAAPGAVPAEGSKLLRHLDSAACGEGERAV